MSEPCDIPGCDEPSVVGINSRRVCTTHIDQAMGEAFAPVRHALREANADD